MDNREITLRLHSRYKNDEDFLRAITDAIINYEEDGKDEDDCSECLMSDVNIISCEKIKIEG